MATSITKEMIDKINEAYAANPVYAAVARSLGVSPGTVKKYVSTDYMKKSDVMVKPLEKGLLQSVEKFILSKEDLLDDSILQLDAEEIEEIVKFWAEISI